MTYPWEVLPKISRFIVELGNTLSEEEYEKQGENIWIAKTAKVAKKRIHYGTGDHRKRSRGQTFARLSVANAIVGEGAVVGKFDRTEECDPVQ